MTSVTIIGRRWCRRQGGVYHTATILIDGVCVGKLPESGGGDGMYEQNAVDWLERNGYMPGRHHAANGSAEPAWRYFRDDRGIAYSSWAIDVAREKDL